MSHLLKLDGGAILQLNGGYILLSPEDPVAVPDVVGETQAAGTIDLLAAGFVVSVSTAYDSIVPLGIIISQSPLGGSSALPGTTVTIVVSLGPPSGNMPNLVGLNFYMAIEELQALGIYIPLAVYAFTTSTITVQWVTSGQYAPGIVVAQSVPAGSDATPGENITLSIARFPFASVIDMPPDWIQNT